jgi:predicted transcriptional regulator
MGEKLVLELKCDICKPEIIKNVLLLLKKEPKTFVEIYSELKKDFDVKQKEVRKLLDFLEIKNVLESDHYGAVRKMPFQNVKYSLNRINYFDHLDDYIQNEILNEQTIKREVDSSILEKIKEIIQRNPRGVSPLFLIQAIRKEIPETDFKDIVLSLDYLEDENVIVREVLLREDFSMERYKLKKVDDEYTMNF